MSTPQTIPEMYEIFEPYSALFNIWGDGAGGASLLDQVEQEVRDWVEGLPGAGPESVESPTYFRGAAGAAGYSGVWLQWPFPQQPAALLSCDIKLATEEGERVEVGIESRVVNPTGAQLPPQLLTGPLRLVNALVKEFDCRVGNERLASVVSRRELPDIVAHILDSERVLPVIVVSSDRQDQMPLSPDWLQQYLAGSASVAAYNTGPAGHWQSCGLSIPCYYGAVRIYQPGCRPDDERNRHHVWIPNQAQRLGRLPLRHLLDELRRHIHTPAIQPMFDRVKDRVQAEQHTEMESLFSDAGLQVENLQSEIAVLQQRLQQRDDEVRGLKYRLQYRSEPVPEDDDEIPEYNFENVEDVVFHANEKLANLHFLPSAWDSADKYSYNNPGRLWGTFVALNELAPELSRGSIGMSVKAWMEGYKRRTGANCETDYSPNESEATMNRYGYQRRFDYDGQTIEMQGHFKFGSGRDSRHCLRLHLAWERERNRWLIGHVGRHLDTNGD